MKWAILASIATSGAAIERFPNLFRWLDLLPVAANGAVVMLTLVVLSVACGLLALIQNIRGARSAAVSGVLSMLVPLMIGLELIVSDGWAFQEVTCVVAPCPVMALSDAAIESGREMGLLLLVLFMLGTAMGIGVWFKSSGRAVPVRF